MTFPTEPRPMLFELQTVATDWTNITGDVYSKRQPIRITSGVPGEYNLAQPATCGFQINNAAGRYSPRNPLSLLYKQVGRNTPVRVSIGDSAKGMVLSGVGNSAGRATTPDSAALSITGDQDIRIDLETLSGLSDVVPIGNVSGVTSSWTAGSFDLASKYDDNNAARSWTVIDILGKLRYNWFPLGTVASARFAESTVALPAPQQGRKALRITHDVDNGAGGTTITFYTAPTMAGPWTVLGAPVVSAGTTSIFDGTAPLRFGGCPWNTSYTYGAGPSATYYAAELRNGINGTVVASPDFSTQPLDPSPFTTSAFTDAQGNSWNYNGAADAARIWYGNVDVRFCGECSSFPTRWDESENDKWVPIEAAGLLRRLGTGSDPAPAGIKDWVLAQANQPTSYFPLGGGDGTTYSVNLGRVGTKSTRFYAVDAPAYTYGKDLNAPWLGTGMELTLSGLGHMRADVVAGDDNFALDFVFQSTHLGRLEYWIYDLSGNIWKFMFNDNTDGQTVKVDATLADGSVASFTATAALPVLGDGALHTARIMITSGAGGYQIFSVYIDGILVRTSDTSFLLGNPWGGTWFYKIVYGRTGAQEPINLAHLTLWSFPSALSIPAVTAYDFAARGFAGEDAVARMQRVATTGAIPFTYEGNAGEAMAMGPLYSESKLSQLRDAEAADMGMLLERRDQLGLKYRTRGSLVNQTPGLTLDYVAGQVVGPFEPTDDDAFTRNDLTVSRRDGDSVRVTATTGRLSVSEPPVGVGRYHDEISLNVQTDELLAGIAAWLVNLGTVDQPRYPTVTADLGILAAASLDKAARALDSGDLLVIKNMGRVGIYEDVRLLVLGRADETVDEGGYRHRITWNCAPYQGYEGFVWADGVSMLATDARWDSPGCTLVSGISSTATSFQVTSSATLWTTDVTAFPLDVVMEGERMTVGAITGTSNPQTFSSVTRSVNGVVKAQSAGADIRLATPSYWSL